MLALQETTSWDVDITTVSGFVLCGCKVGSITLLVTSSIYNVRRSWCDDERCTVSIIATMMVVNVHAPDCAKNFEEYEKLMQMLKRVLSERRKEGARR